MINDDSALTSLWGLVSTNGKWYPAQLRKLGKAASIVCWEHPARPCTLQVSGRSVRVYEVLHRPWFGTDHIGTKKLTYCGAVLANLEAAIRALGWSTTTEITAHANEPDLVGTVRAVAAIPPTELDRARASVLHGEYARYPHPGDTPLTTAETEELLASIGQQDVAPLTLRTAGELAALARVFGQDASSCGRPDPPGAFTGQTIVLVATPNEGRPDLIKAGLVAQRMWLGATARGYHAAVDVSLLQEMQLRHCLRDELHVRPTPQLLVRLSKPAEQTLSA